jgi:2-succinyl-5-enolpyruvyl-6-hydroxy-3-cyclohexene-1-carboxylate synthase
MTASRQAIVDVAEICVRHGITDVVVSPGSRSAPLTLALARHPDMDCRVIVDERAAAFVALGMAQQKGKPALLVCTSGTAALNYGPAVAEAYYQQIPLLIFTADRPPEWLEQRDNQTIRQHGLYGEHCRAFFELPVETTHPDAAWHAGRIVSEAIITSQMRPAGPVHVNVPQREPLYTRQPFNYRKDVKIILPAFPKRKLDPECWPDLSAEWGGAKRKMLLIGMLKPGTVTPKNLQRLQESGDVLVLSDVTANYAAATPVAHFDIILSSTERKLRQALAPDLLITIGGAMVSTSLKRFLREHKPPHHWHIEPSTAAMDTYQSLTRILQCDEDDFLGDLVASLSADSHQTDGPPGSFIRLWQEREQAAASALRRFLAEARFCELQALQIVFEMLPPQSKLQLGNSSIVRLASLLTVPVSKGMQVNANRGTSGIDGTVSTAVGAALVADTMTTLITGDLGFFYDRNALWQEDLPKHLRIIVFNNFGGGIFRILDGSRDQDELDVFFEASHNLNAEVTAREHGLNYFSAANLRDLQAVLSDFFAPTGMTALLEVKFDKHQNAEEFLQFKSRVRKIP